jgi:hypothetical protein
MPDDIPPVLIKITNIALLASNRLMLETFGSMALYEKQYGSTSLRLDKRI